MKKGLILILVFTLLFSIFSFIVSAQPPTFIQGSLGDNTYDIKIPPITTIPLNREFTFNFHVFNKSNGVPIDNSSTKCFLHHYNSSGGQIYEAEIPHSTSSTIVNEWEVTLNQNNFTDYNMGYLVQCNSSVDNQGGYEEVNLNLNATGNELEIPESIIYITILFFTFILFGLFLYLAVTIPYRNEISPNGKFVTEVTKSKYAKLLCIWFTYGFFMWFLQTLNFISISFIKAATLTNFITNILIYVGSMSVGITFLILTWMFVAMWKDIIYNKQIRELGKAFIKGNLGGV